MKGFKTLAIIVLLIVLVSCAALAKTNKYEASLIQDINLIVSNWDTILSNSDLSYENINSWLPNSGIRGRYELLRNNLSIRSLEQIFGLKVFLKGPHMDDINLKIIK
jgi:hypothetical protein